MDKINLNPANSALNPKNTAQNAEKVDKNEFANLLKKSVDELNLAQKTSEKALSDMASGQIQDLHQAGIAISRAEMSMKLMLEVRNKAISAYKEILRTQI